MKYECPNCNQFTYEKGWSKRGLGWRLLVGLPLFSLLIPGASAFYGGDVSFEDIGIIILASMIIGLLIIIYSYISPQKTINYKCSNCGFNQEHEI
tara:strand:- start:157 stop:441 length:285 start_codon:yes stop_codon:yes gene_type:complete